MAGSVSATEEGTTGRTSEESTPETWEAPPRTWALFALLVVTSGLWVPAYVYRVSRILRPDKSAWWPAIGSLIPLINLVVIRNIVLNVAAIARSVDQRAPSAGAYVVAVLACNLVGYLLRASSLVGVMVGSIIATLPWCALNLRLNSLLRDAGAEVTRSPWRWGYLGPLLVGVAVTGTDAWASRPDLRRWGAQPLEAGTWIRGESGLYEVQVPAAGWMRVGPGTLYPGSKGDLELLGPEKNLSVAVYLYDDGQSLDDRVDDRRQTVRSSTAGPVAIDEDRYFLPDSDMTVASHARYSLPSAALEVVTVGTDHRLVEVVGFGARAHVPVIREMAKSTRFVPGPKEAK